MEWHHPGAKCSELRSRIMCLPEIFAKQNLLFAQQYFDMIYFSVGGPKSWYIKDL